jgi:hypothetical protein
VKFDAATPLRVITDVLFRNLGLKLLALVMTAILFVSTRDDVTRSFEVPLRVIPDPDRVLLTKLPDTIQVKVRGPWTRLNRLQDYDFESARFDLREAAPGPLRIEEGAIVMPPGVVFSKIEYDHVDLRFEPVVTKSVDIKVTKRGEPAPDYEVTGFDAKPPRWTIRGGQSDVQKVQEVVAETVDVTGATHDVIERKALIRPQANVSLDGAEVQMPRIDVIVKIRPVEVTREQKVPAIVPDKLDPTGAVPEMFTVQISGPLPAFRVLERLGMLLPIEAEVVELDEKAADGGKVLEVRFHWAESVPPEVRESLSFDPDVARVPVPPAPKPSAPPQEEPI